MNQKKIESNNKSSSNFFTLSLNENKSLKDFQDYTWVIVNNIKIKLKLKITNENSNIKTNIKTGTIIKVVKKEEKILNNEKVIQVKPNTNFKSS